MQQPVNALHLIVVRPETSGEPNQHTGISDGRAHLAVTHTARVVPGSPVDLRTLPRHLPNLTQIRPDAGLVWLIHRPGSRAGVRAAWFLVPALPPQSGAEPLADEIVSHHINGWTAGRNFAHTNLSGLSELMGADGFYGAVAVHDLRRRW